VCGKVGTGNSRHRIIPQKATASSRAKISTCRRRINFHSPHRFWSFLLGIKSLRKADPLDKEPQLAALDEPKVCSMRMQVAAFTRQLVDIESVTGNEDAIGHFLLEQLRLLGYHARRVVVDGERANVYATSPQAPRPTIVFSTHMDTVPPFIPSS